MPIEGTRNRTKAHLILPNFIAVGPPRTGTTWLNAVLDGHAVMPQYVKETDFFSWHYDKGIEWYAAHFQSRYPNGLVGEVCPGYFASMDAVERIAVHIPDCRIVVTLRNPVERAYSHYKMLRHHAFVRDISFEQALEKRPEIMEANRYAQHLKAWIDKFGKERVLVCLFGDLRREPQAFVKMICRFIGAPPINLSSAPVRQRDVNSFELMPKNLWLARRARKFRARLKKREFQKTIRWLRKAGVWDFCLGRGEKFPPLNAETHERLLQELLPEIEELEHLIGRDLSNWKQPYASRSLETGRSGKSSRESASLPRAKA